MAKQIGVFLGLNQTQADELKETIRVVIGNEAEMNTANIKELLRRAYGLSPDSTAGRKGKKF